MNKHNAHIKSVLMWNVQWSVDLVLLLIVRFVGKLVGRYYDSQGNPTKYLKGVEVKAARGAQLLEKQKKEEAKQPSCNSRWSQEDGGEVYIFMTWKPCLSAIPLDNYQLFC